MRLISMALTVDQVVSRQKTVTRRLGWRGVKPGDRLEAVAKSQGRYRGACDGCGGSGCTFCYGTGAIVEPLIRLAVIEVVSVRREPVDAITPDDVAREGFPSLTPAEFVEKFCRAMKCGPEAEVTRIEFRYIEREAPACA